MDKPVNRQCYRGMARFLGFFLSLTLTLPNPALALHQLEPTQNAGLEQALSAVLKHSAPTAGMEEGTEFKDLFHRIHDPDPDIRRYAVGAIAALAPRLSQEGADAAVQEVIPLFSDSALGIRRRAVEVIEALAPRLDPALKKGFYLRQLGFPEGLDWDGMARFSGVWNNIQRERSYSKLSLGGRAALRWQLLLAARRSVELGQQWLNHVSRLEKLDQTLGLPSMGAEIHLSPEEGTRAAPVAVNLAVGAGPHSMVPVHPEGADLLDIRLVPGTLSSFSMLFRQFLESSEVKRLRTVVGHYSVGVDLKEDVVVILLALFFGDTDHPWAPRKARGGAIAGVPGSNTYRGQTLDIHEGDVINILQTNLDVRPAMVNGEILAYDDLEAVALLSRASTEPPGNPMRVLFDRFLKKFDEWLQEVGGTELRNVVHAARDHIATHSGQREGTSRDLDRASYLIFEKLHGISPDRYWEINAELRQIAQRVEQAQQDGKQPNPKDMEEGRALTEQYTQSNDNGRPHRGELKKILDETLGQIRSAVLVDPQVVEAVQNYRRAVIQGESLEYLDNRYQEAVERIRNAIFDRKRTSEQENRLLDLLQAFDPEQAAKARAGLLRNGEKTPPDTGLEERWDGIRSRSDLHFVVVGPGLGKHPAIRLLAGLEDHVVVEGPDPLDTVVTLMERGARSAIYLGGLEEFQRFDRVAGQVLAVSHELPAATLPLQLRQIFPLLGVPSGISSGLEEIIGDIETFAVEA